jgi:hypothetical protein
MKKLPVDDKAILFRIQDSLISLARRLTAQYTYQHCPPTGDK